MIIRFGQDWINDVNTIRQEMQRLMDYLAGTKPPMVRFSPTVWQPAIDIYETEDEFVAIVELAGIKVTDLQIVVDRNIFTIRGERPKILPGSKTGVYHQMEIASGPFERSITLPEAVDAENATATYGDGLISVVLPKGRKQRSITVGIKVK